MLLVWLVLFLLRKDVRKEMLFLSFLIGICGVLTEYIYTIDWWRPLTITNTRVGIEDFLFGFWIGGISAVLYEEIFKKSVYPRKGGIDQPVKHIFLMIFLVGISFYSSFYIFKLHSFYASIVAIIPSTLFIWFKRKDLIPDSLATGFLVPLVGFIWFWIPEYITPGWVNNHWYLNNLSGVVILKAPLEDLIWGFLVGTYVGPLYEFWQGTKLAKYKPLFKKKRKYL